MNLTRSKRLTPTMRRQLAEMATIATEGKTGAAHWRPFGSEWATAEALERRGFLKQDFSNYGRGNVYTLTPEGLAAVTSTGKEASDG